MRTTNDDERVTLRASRTGLEESQIEIPLIIPIVIVVVDTELTLVCGYLQVPDRLGSQVAPSRTMVNLHTMHEIFKGVSRVFEDIDAVFTDIDKSLESGFRTFTTSIERDVRAGAYSVKSGPDGTTVTVDVPGCSREDVSVTVEGRILRLAGTRPGTKSSFERNFKLAVSSDATAIVATVKDGVLTVAVPGVKRPPETRVDIKVG